MIINYIQHCVVSNTISYNKQTEVYAKITRYCLSHLKVTMSCSRNQSSDTETQTTTIVIYVFTSVIYTVNHKNVTFYF